ncbi:6726_t:CDS:2 [Racocetra fulgida]|uniref:glutamate decarboxylase n=1 Tax=Racocetra fulgida TaxID=60492 RepID=A0A9N9FZP7_9GLOM|nr:6726_t:CDS:2 [Racocetra fulgida]
MVYLCHIVTDTQLDKEKDERSEQLDGNPVLNLASFVTTYMEDDAEQLMKENLSKNFIDFEEYPVSVELQNRCVSIIARLFNAPVDESIGVSTIGSSEAIMLAILSMKRLWKNRRISEGKPVDKPNLVMAASVNDLLLAKNQKNGWDVPIHVDAAAGGFVAPFVNPDLVWDFRLTSFISLDIYNDIVAVISPTAKYYVLIRLGRQGFTSIMRNLMCIADYLAARLEATNKFTILSDRNGNGLPLVAFKLKAKDIHYDEYDVAQRIREHQWIVPAYTMAPNIQHIKLLRVVVREDFSRERCDIFITDLMHTIDFLDKLDKNSTYLKSWKTLKNATILGFKNQSHKTNGVC